MKLGRSNIMGSLFRVIALPACLLLGPFFQAQAEPLDAVVTSRPPYYVLTQSGSVGGIVGQRATDVFEAAGLDIDWTVVSFKRQLQLIEANRSAVCGIGWFKNPDREAFAKFTDHIYQDQPLVALIRHDNEEALSHGSLAGLMAGGGLTLGMKLGFSYGSQVDALIASSTPETLTTDQSIEGMIRMLAGRRFDYMISSPEEAGFLLEQLADDARSIRMVELEDLQPQNKRYILCSMSVSDDVISRLNKAIAETIW